MATKIQLRRDTAANWGTANPVLADGEMGIEKDTKLWKIGDGVKNWNTLEYATVQLAGTANIIDFTAQPSAPTPPSVNHLKAYTRTMAGRTMLRAIGQFGMPYSLQPALFSANIFWLTTGSSNAYTAMGQVVAVTGTITHPVQTEAFGYLANQVTAASVNATAGANCTNSIYLRGTIVGANGFFFKTRLLFPDATYDTTGASTGTRSFVGLTSNSLAAMVNIAAATGDYCGFSRHSETGLRVEANWQFITRDNITTTIVDTGMPFAVSKLYDFYIYCPPQSSVVYWRIENISDGTFNEGSTSDTLPTGSVFMRAGFQLATINALARNIRMQHLYAETDR